MLCWVKLRRRRGAVRTFETEERAASRRLRPKKEELYPQAERIRVICDSLSTHSPAAFYETFDAQIAHRLARRIEFVYTPVHGSWLNMAEIELSVLVRQCLRRRRSDTETLERETATWAAERNRSGGSVDWRFTTADARNKLRSLYPSQQL